VPGTLHDANASGRHASLPKVVDQPQPRLCYPLPSILQLNFRRSFAVSSLLCRYFVVTLRLCCHPPEILLLAVRMAVLFN
jgi:hypothetical protein